MTNILLIILIGLMFAIFIVLTFIYYLLKSQYQSEYIEPSIEELIESIKKQGDNDE